MCSMATAKDEEPSLQKQSQERESLLRFKPLGRKGVRPEEGLKGSHCGGGGGC